MRLAAGLTHLPPLLATLFAACDGGPAAPWVPTPRRELTAEDYAVYSAWLAPGLPEPGRLVLVHDRTSNSGYPSFSLVEGLPEAVASLAAHPVGTKPPAPSGPRDEALQDFLLQQDLSLPLKPRLKGPSYELVRDPVARELLSRAGLAVAFSRVGFDRRVQVATCKWLRPPPTMAVGPGG